MPYSLFDNIQYVFFLPGQHGEIRNNSRYKETVLGTLKFFMKKSSIINFWSSVKAGQLSIKMNNIPMNNIAFF